VASKQAASQQSSPPSKRARRWRRVAAVVCVLLLGYLVFAYLVMPIDWTWYLRRHPSLEDIPGVTLAAHGIPGDPLNVALVGTEDEVKKALLAAQWYPADPLTLRSCLAIAADTVLKRSYDQAPVSSLYLWGRKEDLAFEQPVGDNPRHRHHVRFWRSEKTDRDGRPVWVGAATYDERVGFSHTTGQITHHISPNVDADRDYLVRCLEEAGGLSETCFVDNFHKIREGRNGGGDPWHTDGRLIVGVIVRE